MAVLVAVSLAAAAPALAVTKGAVTPILTVQAGGKYYYTVTWGGNMTGWKRGTLTIDVKFFVDGSLAGQRSNECENSTSCSVPNTTQTFSELKAWTVTVEGCGPGGCDSASKSA